ACSSVTDAANASACAPCAHSDSAAADTPASSVSSKARRAPWRANARAHARPMPLAAPVMTTLFPSRSAWAAGAPEGPSAIWFKVKVRSILAIHGGRAGWPPSYREPLLYDVLPFLQCGGRTFEHDAAMPHHVHARGHLQGDGQFLLYQQHRHAAPVNVGD